MASALIISSFVAKSRVGGVIQMLAFNALGVEASLIPSVVFGRHPGLGAPGGGAVDPAVFASVIEGAEAGGALDVDVIVTGYFALPEQVETAAEAILRARRRTSPPLVLVDPILGDEGPGLYVKPQVEAAIRRHLLPLADVLAPNLWELRRLTGATIQDAPSAAAAARSFGCPVLVSSVPCGADQIGVLYVESQAAWLATHAKAVQAPRGVGDLLKALFAAGLMEKAAPQTALVRAVGGLADAVEAALSTGSSDLLLAGQSQRLRNPVSRVALTTVA